MLRSGEVFVFSQPLTCKQIDRAHVEAGAPEVQWFDRPVPFSGVGQQLERQQGDRRLELVLQEIRALGRQPVQHASTPSRDPDALLSISDVARLLGCSTRQVSRLLNEGAFSFVRVGRHRKVRRAELERYVASRELARE